MNKTRPLRTVTGAPIAEARGEKALALAAELRALATSLERGAEGKEASDPAVHLVDYARAVASARAELDRSIGTSWLTDPALEILLNAFVAERPGGGTAGQGALVAVPHTARRWALLLEQAGLLTLGGLLGPRLTDAGRHAVCRYLLALSGRGVDRAVN